MSFYNDQCYQHNFRILFKGKLYYKGDFICFGLGVQKVEDLPLRVISQDPRDTGRMWMRGTGVISESGTEIYEGDTVEADGVLTRVSWNPRIAGFELNQDAMTGRYKIVKSPSEDYSRQPQELQNE